MLVDPFLYFLCIFSFFFDLSLVFLFVVEKKNDKMPQKIILTCKGHVEQPFDGQNTQQWSTHLLVKIHNISGTNLDEKFVNGTVDSRPLSLS